jgi:sodium/hydrogen antiporter
VGHFSLILIALGILVFSLFSGRLKNSILTLPLAFVLFGFALNLFGQSDVVDVLEHPAIRTLFESTLILILFSDASRIDLRQLKREHNLPIRMLVVGLPFTIFAGALIGKYIFPDFAVWELLLLAAILSPTDAALGQSVVSEPIVPVRIRQSLNVESGLNDGIALSAVLVFAALSMTSSQPIDRSVIDWMIFGGLQVTLGPIMGIVIGYLGAKLIDQSASAEWMTGAFEGASILALAALSFLLSEAVGGNGFISAFSAGLVFGNTIQSKCKFLFEFMETEGQLLTLITFLIFGYVLLPIGIAAFDMSILIYAVLSLTVVRMVPVAVSLVGSKVRMPTVFFLGWFGPRGIASILFALLILGKNTSDNINTIFAVTIITVALSVLLHGISAAPLAKSYSKHS